MSMRHRFPQSTARPRQARWRPVAVALVALLALPAAAPPPAMAQPARKEAPPALVAVTAIKSGVMAPQTELLGTVFFAEVSDVAAEVAGIVSAVRVEDGQRIDAGQPLVALGTELKAKRLEAARAAHQQALAELEVARIDLERREALFRKNSISAQSYDDNRFKVKALERRAGALQAEVERVALEIAKALIRAPFGGVVVRRSVDRGEWIAEGKTVAVVARDDVVDVVIEVPESIVRRIRTGQKVRVRVGDVTRDGVVEAVVPRGDVATRTFPVKVRCENRHSWIEGMSAAVALPTEAPRPAFIVPRDALALDSGQTVVFAVADGKSRAIPVVVVGYEGLEAGITGGDLAEGLPVVVKGNERLRDGQDVTVAR